MWILEIFGRNGYTRQLLLVAGTYTLGRSDCDVNLPDDPSLSRHHITLTVIAVGASHLEDIAHVPTLLLSDHSKHGTWVNDSKVLSTADKLLLQPRDVIVLGRSAARIRVHYAPLIVVLSETLSFDETKMTQGYVAKLGGSCLRNEVPTIDALRAAGVSPLLMAFVAKCVTCEAAAMLSFINRYVLVNVEYIKALHDLVKDELAVTLTSLPRPFNYEAVRDPALTDVPYFRPEPCLFGVEEFATSNIAAASQLFRTVHFLFLDHVEVQCFHKYGHIIATAGGTASLIKGPDVLTWERQSSRVKRRETRAALRRDGGLDLGSSLDPSDEDESDPASAAMDNRRGPPTYFDKMMPLMGLKGIPPHAAHGLNIWVIVAAAEYSHLLDHLSTHGPHLRFRGGHDEHDDDDPNTIRVPPELCVTGGGGSDENSSDVAAGLNAYLALWDAGYSLVHEHNIWLSAYACEATPQLRANGPGVLSKFEMAPPTAAAIGSGSGEDTDSNATVEDLQEEYDQILTMRRSVRGAVGDSSSVLLDSLGRSPSFSNTKAKRRDLSPAGSRRAAKVEAAMKRLVQQGVSISSPLASPRSRAVAASSPARKHPSGVVVCKPEQLTQAARQSAHDVDRARDGAAGRASSSSPSHPGGGFHPGATDMGGVVGAASSSFSRLHSSSSVGFQRTNTSWSVLSGAAASSDAVSSRTSGPAARSAWDAVTTGAAHRSATARSDLYSQWRTEMARATPFDGTAHNPAADAVPLQALSDEQRAEQRRRYVMTVARRSPTGTHTSLPSGESGGSDRLVPVHPPLRTARETAILGLCHRFDAPLFSIEKQVLELGRRAAAHVTHGSSADSPQRRQLQQDVAASENRVTHFLICLKGALHADGLPDSSTAANHVGVPNSPGGPVIADSETLDAVDDMRQRSETVLSACETLLRRR